MITQYLRFPAGLLGFRFVLPLIFSVFISKRNKKKVTMNTSERTKKTKRGQRRCFPKVAKNQKLHNERSYNFSKNDPLLVVRFVVIVVVLLIAALKNVESIHNNRIVLLHGALTLSCESPLKHTLRKEQTNRARSNVRIGMKTCSLHSLDPSIDHDTSILTAIDGAQ